TLTSGLSARGNGLRPRMQFVHGSLRIARLQTGPDRQRPGDRLFDERLFVASRWLQDVVDDGALETDMVSRMTDAKTQAPEALVAQALADVAQSIVSRCATAQLQLHGAGLQIELIVGDQNSVHGNAIKLRHPRDGNPTQVH